MDGLLVQYSQNLKKFKYVPNVKKGFTKPGLVGPPRIDPMGFGLRLAPSFGSSDSSNDCWTVRIQKRRNAVGLDSASGCVQINGSNEDSMCNVLMSLTEGTDPIY